MSLNLFNPYEPPQFEEEEKKYKKPIVDWGLLLFTVLVYTVPFSIILILQMFVRGF